MANPRARTLSLRADLEVTNLLAYRENISSNVATRVDIKELVVHS